MASPLPLPTPSPKPEPESSKPTPKSAPLPWSHQETLALIQAYQDKWYSLKKGQLKAFQWEEVAVTVAARCGFDHPTKTATQCRHKIEKLRKRYRSELQKPYPTNSWQYFDLMDRMERGPINARPIASAVVHHHHYPGNADVVVVGSSRNSNGSSNSGSNPRYAAMLYSGPAGYRINSNNSEGSDESDEEWNGVGGGEAARRSKSRSINNLVREDVRSGGKRVGIESERVMRACRNEMNGKRKQFYGGNESDEDDDEDDLEEEVEEEDEMGLDGGREVAAEIKGFMERFMRMENKKIEMMRETERYRLEMEKKRMEMILDAQRKIVDTISRAFGTNKKVKIVQET